MSPPMVFTEGAPSDRCLLPDTQLVPCSLVPTGLLCYPHAGLSVEEGEFSAGHHGRAPRSQVASWDLMN